MLTDQPYAASFSVQVFSAQQHQPELQDQPLLLVSTDPPGKKDFVTPEFETMTNYLWTVASFFALLVDLVEDGHDGSQLYKG